MKRPLAAAAAFSLTLLTGACSGDADSGNAADDTPDTTQATDADAATTEDAGTVPPPEGKQGRVTVAGQTITFTPSMVCLIGPDGVGFSGPGETADGTPAYVDSGGANTLTVYLGTDDPFEVGDAQYEHADPMSELGQLKIEGNALSAQPDMVRSDDGSFDPAGTAQIVVSCE